MKDEFMAACSGKIFIVFVALLLCATIMPAQVRAEDPALRNCTWCHGSGAQGYSPAPRLAGQRASYLQGQLTRFRMHGRESPTARQYMWAASEYLSGERARTLANYLARLDPMPAKDGDISLVDRGRAIYQNGLPEANIVACVACHGPNGQGVGAIPRLSGLSHSYLGRRLREWQNGYNHAGAIPMPHIAGNLSGEQVDALASYLSFMP